MVIDFSKVNLKDKPTLILRNLDGTAIQTLGYAFNVKAEIMYNEVSTLTFDLPSKVSNVNTPHYDDVVGMRIVDLKDWGQFLLVDPEETSDGIRKLKSCKAYSLEYEFAKKNITLENGTYNFWNPLSPDNTIVGRILEKFPDWAVGYIDTSLVGKYRTFDVIDDKVYNFIKSEVQDTYGCIFEFDTYKRTINIVSTAFDDDVEPPKPIYLSSERLIKEIKISEDSDSIITCLDVNGGDGVSIRSVNPTGTNKIYNLDYFMNETNFSEDFIEKWRTWEKDCKQQQKHYFNTTMEYNLQVARLITEQAALTDLKGELTSLENIQATIIQGIAQNLKEQKDLDKVNADIKAMKKKISAKESLIKSVNDDIEDILSSLSNVNSMLSMDKYFTTKELSILQKYFIEDSLQDESFVAASATTYSNEDISNTINGAELSLNNGDIELSYDGENKTMYTISGGVISISSLCADIVRATVEFNDDSTFVFTSYLNQGTVGESKFESGCITAIGSYKIIINKSNTLSFMIYDGTLYFTKNTTDYEQHAIEEELYEYGQQVLAEKAEPTYSFSIESGNFLAIDDFISFKNELTMGKRVYLKIDEQKPITPYVISISIDFEKNENFNLEFSSTYTSSDRNFRLAKLLEQSVSMGKTLNAKSGIYSEFVNSGASTRVKSFMDSALDIAKNTVMSSGSQAIEFGDAGIRVRKWADSSHASYSDEQIWIVDNVIAFTTDNWATSNMAIGKIYDENIMNEDGTKGGFAYGIAAPYLVGTILAGEHLIIDTNNGAFKVDESGVYIDSLKFYITHGGDSYDTTLEGELTKMKQASDKIAEDMNSAIKDLNENIARTVTTYYQDKVPDDAHEGDLWYTTGTCSGYAYRNVNVGDSIEEFDFDRTAQPKCTVEETVVALSNGDTFSSTIDGNLISNKWGTVYSNGVWTDFAYGYAAGFGMEYPIVTAINIDNPFYSAILGYCNTEFPVGKLYRYNGRTWDEITDADTILAIEKAANAQATADGKIVSYYQNYAPHQPTIGDIWYNTASDKKVTRHIEVGDNLSGVTLTFDTTKIISTLPDDDTDYVVISNNGEIIAENDATIELFSTDSSNSKNGVIMALYVGNSRPTWIFTSEGWQVEAITVPSTFGIVESVDKESPFYELISATFTSNYEPKKLYRFDGYAWILVEDGDIEKIQSDVSTIDKTLSEIITTEGYLKASKLNGVIDGVNAQMQAAKGNVLFDSDGIWLLNNTAKTTSTKAIWMNENGMLFGKGSACDNPSATDSGWEWTTAIDHDGIVAEALAGKKLSGCEIYGGYLNITDKEGKGFVVTGDGELTATKGIFKSVVQASDFRDKDGKSMMSSKYQFNSEYLSLYGLEIKNKSEETTLLIDSDGNVTLKGGITLDKGSKIVWANIDETNSSAYKKADSAYNYAGKAHDRADSAYSKANGASSAVAKLANGTYTSGTFISGTEIASPRISGGQFFGVEYWNQGETVKMILGNGGGNLGDWELIRKEDSLSVFRIMDDINSTVLQRDRTTFMWTSGANTYPSGTWNFSNAIVTGLTARFG